MNLDRFDSEYHKKRFPDSQEQPRDEYSTCSGCGEIIYIDEGTCLDVYGMAVHDDYVCLKKSVEAKIVDIVKE